MKDQKWNKVYRRIEVEIGIKITSVRKYCQWFAKVDLAYAEGMHERLTRAPYETGLTHKEIDYVDTWLLWHPDIARAMCERERHFKAARNLARRFAISPRLAEKAVFALMRRHETDKDAIDIAIQFNIPIALVQIIERMGDKIYEC